MIRVVVARNTFIHALSEIRALTNRLINFRCCTNRFLPLISDSYFSQLRPDDFRSDLLSLFRYRPLYQDALARHIPNTLPVTYRLLPFCRCVCEIDRYFSIFDFAFICACSRVTKPTYRPCGIRRSGPIEHNRILLQGVTNKGHLLVYILLYSMSPQTVSSVFLGIFNPFGGFPYVRM